MTADENLILADLHLTNLLELARQFRRQNQECWGCGTRDACGPCSPPRHAPGCPIATAEKFQRSLQPEESAGMTTELMRTVDLTLGKGRL